MPVNGFSQSRSIKAPNFQIANWRVISRQAASNIIKMTHSMKDFKVLAKLGEGSFGEVVKVRRVGDDKEYALKKMKIDRKKEKDIENALNEVRILASIDDPHIISYKEAFYDQASQSICIVMEFANGGDLQSKINEHYKRSTGFSEEEVWKVAVQLLGGLRVLQDKKILHRDIKSANVFFVNGVAKLGDMNVSKVTEASLAYTQTGTPYYASPEVWREEPYSYKSDIWSLGCVLYEMCALRPPFRARSIDQLYKKVQRGVYDRLPAKYSQALASMVGDCLVVDVKRRANLDSLLQLCTSTEPKEGKPMRLNASDSRRMLETIKVPRNLSDINSVLPRPNYEEKPKQLVSPRIQRKTSHRRLNVLDLFTIKKLKPQPRDNTPRSNTPNSQALRQIKSQKFLPDVPYPPKPDHPVSAQLLPENPSFKNILHSFESPLEPGFMDKCEQIDMKRRERYEKEKQYLAQLSAKKRPGLHLHMLSPTKVVPLRMP